MLECLFGEDAGFPQLLSAGQIGKLQVPWFPPPNSSDWPGWSGSWRRPRRGQRKSAVVETGEHLALAHTSIRLGQDRDDNAFAQCGYVHLVFDHNGARGYETRPPRGRGDGRRTRDRRRRAGYSRGLARVAACVQRKRHGHHGRELNNPFHKPSNFWPTSYNSRRLRGGQDARWTAGAANFLPAELHHPNQDHSLDQIQMVGRRKKTFPAGLHPVDLCRGPACRRESRRRDWAPLPGRRRRDRSPAPGFSD